MSTTTPAQRADASLNQPCRIKLVSHSMVFYWWPVWAVGLLLGFLTLLDGQRMAIVPEGTRLRASTDGSQEKNFELEVPAKGADQLVEEAKTPGGATFVVPVARSKAFGLLFCFVLLLVIFSTNVVLRGLWSIIALLLIVIVAGLLAMFHLLPEIVGRLDQLNIYITAAGYLFPSSLLLVLWAGTVFIYDQNRYITVTPGQLIVHQDVGDMRQMYDTTNVTVEKRRSDFFRHILLGFFSGDVVVQIQGGQAQTFVLPNVLFAGWKVQQVADLMKTRIVMPEK
jgi:hypothetical protein